MSFFDAFDQIRIINLPARSDRRREMDEQLAKIGLLGDPRVRYFPAERPDDAGRFSSIGAHGCYLSHKYILAQAAAAGESVLILEDDCDFTDAAHKPKPQPGSNTIETAWDIFYGGYYAHNPEDLQASDIIGSHMMGFSREGARRVSAYIETLDPDTEIHPPIDATYVWFRRAYSDVRTRFAVPLLAEQRSSPSDVAPQKWYHRLPFAWRFKRIAERLLKL